MIGCPENFLLSDGCSPGKDTRFPPFSIGHSKGYVDHSRAEYKTDEILKREAGPAACIRTDCEYVRACREGANG